MTALPHLHDVTGDGLPDYPFDPDLRLPGHHFLPLDFNRFLNSQFGMRADLEVQGLFVRLLCLSQTQRPVGTLPPDHHDLAYLCRIDQARFNRLVAGDFGALYGWVACLAGAEIRLMHPVVNEALQFAISGREKRIAGKSKEADRQRIKRLKDGLKAHGCVQALLDDDALIDRIDRWMTKNVKTRTADAYLRGLEHATQQKWITPMK